MILHKLHAILLGKLICQNSFTQTFRSVLTLSRYYGLPTMASGKLDTPQFKALLTPDLLRLEELFRSEGHSLRLVGGAVRDLLLGQHAKDIDLATECVPEKMLEILEREQIRNIPTGLKHGTITAHMDRDYEITTLRIDRVTDGRHAIVEYTNDWKIDSERRDLTINSMSLGINGTLYDYFEGQRHLAERKVRFVGDARTRIREDYLRILRYFRFFGRISPSPDAHDSDTLTAIKETAHGLQAISVERIWVEMKKILVGKHAPHILPLIYDLGVAKNIGLPSDPNMAEFTAVWSRLTSQNHYTLDPITLLITLVPSPQDAESLAKKWKLSNAERQLGVFVATHRKAAGLETTLLKYFQDLLVNKCLKEHVTEVLNYCGRVDDVRVIEQWKVAVFPVNGTDLKRINIPSGAVMGRMLRQMKDKWIDSYYTLTKDELIDMFLKNR